MFKNFYLFFQEFFHLLFFSFLVLAKFTPIFPHEPDVLTNIAILFAGLATIFTNESNLLTISRTVRIFSNEPNLFTHLSIL